MTLSIKKVFGGMGFLSYFLSFLIFFFLNYPEFPDSCFRIQFIGFEDVHLC